jgi:uncharacterized protein (TIGR02145 family)
MNKYMKQLVAVAFGTLLLGSCQTRDVNPTEPAHESEVELAARLVAAKAPPSATKVRLRLTLGTTVGQWIDTPYVSGGEILLGRVQRGTEVTLDVRAYSLGASNTDTLWKWFARASRRADAALTMQVLEAQIDTIPTSAGLKNSGGASNRYALPAGSLYTLDGRDPKSGETANGSEIAVPAGKMLRAILRIVIAGANDTLLGDTLNVSAPDSVVQQPDPIVPPKEPSFTTGGQSLPSQLAVGSSILIKADTGAKLAYTTDASEPKCANALDGIEHTIKIDSSLAGKTLVLRAVSCRDTSGSPIARRTVEVLEPGETPRQEVVIPAGYDSTGMERKDWKDDVVIGLPSLSSRVVWNLVIKAGVVTTNIWPALPTTQSRSGTAIEVDSALLKGIPATDSVATVLVVAVLFDSANKAQDTAFLRWIIRVPYTPPKAPVISVNEKELPTELGVGASILVKADSAANLAYTTDRTTPVCRNASEASATIKVDASMAGDTLVIRALSCRDSLTSTETRDTVRIAKPDEVIKERISVPTAYQWNASTANHAWTENVALAIHSKSALVWNLRVLPFPIRDENAAWTSLGFPDMSSRTGAGTNLGVAKELLSAIPVTDSVATVLAVVVLYDSTKAAIDTARLRWNIVAPITPMPLLSVVRSPDRLLFRWPVTSTTADARVWYLIGLDTTKVSSYGKGASSDSFIVPAANGTRVKVGVASVSSVTGRSSRQAILDTVALLPPGKPGFTISNIDTVEGKVEIVLDATTRAEKNTAWKAGYALEGSSAVSAYDANFVNDRCTLAVNAGQWRFAVRATRDGIAADSSVSLVAKRTKGVSPGKVSGLEVSRKDSSTVVWSWTRSTATRAYRVYLLRDAAFASLADSTKCLASEIQDIGSVDSFKVTGLANGASVSLAVVALAGNDSAGGNAEAAFGNSVRTLNPPRTPDFELSNTDLFTGRVEVAIRWWNEGGEADWYVAFDSAGGGKFVESLMLDSVVAKNFAVNGNVTVRVKAIRDGYTKSTVKSVPVKCSNALSPKPPSGLSWNRTTNSVTLEWAKYTAHKYRLFWDISSSTNDIDTSAVTTNKESSPSNPYTFVLAQGQRVRIALQTLASGADSTKPSAPVHSSQSTLAAQDPVVTITAKLTNAATRTVTFSWASVTGAVKYKYFSTTDPGTVKETTLNTLTFTYLPGTQDVSFSVQAVNLDGVVSTAATSTLHIPQNRGSTNLAAWNVWTTGTTVTIQGRASGAITGTAPDSVYIWLNGLGESGSQTWIIPYAQLNSFSRSVTLDAAAMNIGRYEIVAQFRWTSSSLKGDTTNIDYRAVSGWAGPAPTAFYQIEDGKMKVGVAGGGLGAVSKRGWTLHVFANYGGNWVDIVNNTDMTTYPNIAEGGFGHYPLGAKQLRVYSDSGVNTSVEHIVPILPGDSVLHEGRTYPIVLFGAKRWITRPMNTLTTDKYCADKTISTDCGTSGRLYTWLEATRLSTIPESGDHEIQGVCPAGWRIPKSSDFVDLANAVEPGWKWVAPTVNPHPYPETYSKLLKAGFEMEGSNWNGTNWSGYPGMWAATTSGTGAYKTSDMWFYDNWNSPTSEQIFTAIVRSEDSKELAQTFCIEK